MYFYMDFLYFYMISLYFHMIFWALGPVGFVWPWMLYLVLLCVSAGDGDLP